MLITSTHLKRVGVVVAAGALITGTIAATASAAPVRTAKKVTTRTATVDDRASAGTNRFSYSGFWRTCARCDRSALGRGYHSSDRVGSVAGLTFTGNRATIYGIAQRTGGATAVYVDGRYTGIARFASRRRAYRAVYTTPWMQAGRHTVTLRVLAGRNRVVAVDKAVVVSTVVPATPRPAPRPVPKPVPKPTTPAPRTTGPTSGFASITFDDGKTNQFENARPVLQAAGVKATFYIISDALGWGASSMSASQVRELAADGHEIGNHTKSHANLKSASGTQAETELSGAQEAIRSATGITPTTCAYPFGQSSEAARSVAARQLRACRGTGGGTNPTSGFSRYDLKTFYVTTSTSTAAVRDAADKAKASGSWVVFVYHGVGQVSSTDDVTTQSFIDQVNAIRGTGIPIRTVASVVS
ncbi:MAG: hypothetical protein QG622_338 [Actinomycetota bacterium]|nr:hypothetical protein [Actinomycetota bacterium]